MTIPKCNDYGESSLTLLSVYAGMDKEEPNIPYDCWDLYRCFHLIDCLDLPILGEATLVHNTAEIYPVWKPFSDNWVKLRKLAGKRRTWNNNLQDLINKCRNEVSQR